MPPKAAPLKVDEEELKRTQILMDKMELKKLMREERLMKDFNPKDETTEKQGKVIAALTEERDELVKNLNVMQSKRVNKMDAEQAKDISSLFAQGDNLDIEIAREKKFIEDLEFQIRKESNQLETHRRNTTSNAKLSDYQVVAENKRADRALDSSKTKLHAVQVQLNQTIQENAEQRRRIQVLLKSKARFNQLFEELVHKLDRGKTIMKEIVEQSQTQIKKRDEVARKIKALKTRDEADLLKRQEEMQDLDARFKEDNLLAQFRYKVLHARTKLSESAKAAKKAEAQRRLQEQELQELQDIWETIKEETEVENSGEICDMVIEQEAENFSLFNYNNELRYQLESLTEQTTELMWRVDDEQETSWLWFEQEERDTYKMKAKLNSLDEHLSDAKDQCEAARRLFNRLMAKVQTLFDIAKCDTWPLEELLGVNESVTHYNYRLYLELLESKVMALLSLVPLVGVHPENVVKRYSVLTTSATPKRSAYSDVVADRKVVTRNCPDCEISKKPTHQSTIF